MSCEMSIPFEGLATDLFTKLQSKIKQNNGTITGADTAGSFSVSKSGVTIAGTYTIAGQELDVTITHKPLLVGCGTIKDFITGFLSGND